MPVEDVIIHQRHIEKVWWWTIDEFFIFSLKSFSSHDDEQLLCTEARFDCDFDVREQKKKKLSSLLLCSLKIALTRIVVAPGRSDLGAATRSMYNNTSSIVSSYP